MLEKLANDIGEPFGVSMGCHMVEGEVLESITEQADLLSADPSYNWCARSKLDSAATFGRYC